MAHLHTNGQVRHQQALKEYQIEDRVDACSSWCVVKDWLLTHQHEECKCNHGDEIPNNLNNELLCIQWLSSDLTWS